MNGDAAGIDGIAGIAGIDGIAAAGPLPIRAILPALLDALGRPGNLVIEAPPGAGKTTVVPLAVLHALGDAGEIIVLQPRRLAARLSALRVAALLGESIGERVGYAVRFDRVASARTRVHFMTEGLLLRRLRDDPELAGVAVVILDEFHERHLDGDLALALLRRRQRAGGGLRLIAMSATLDAEPVATFLDAQRLRASGRTFPVEVEYRSPREQGARRGGRERPLERRVAAAVRELLDGEPDGESDRASDRAPDRAPEVASDDGHVLVFLPGAREIRAAAEACRGLAERANVDVLPLHAQLGRAEQDRVLRPTPGRRKLILATNVAQTSITIDGVSAVIDSGLARIADRDPGTGMPRLSLGPISRAAAAQRAGRAGRTRAGRCVRLYSRHDHDTRRPHDLPEVRRLDLAGPVLELAAAGVEDLATFEWFEAPPDASLVDAVERLGRLGALPQGGGLELTALGRDMLRYPLHPRMARLMLEGVRLGVPDLAARAAAVLAGRPTRKPGEPAERSCDADVLETIAGLERGRPARAEYRRTVRQLERIAGAGEGRPGDRVARERALRQALLAAHPDRVARVRVDAPDRRSLVFAFGGSAELGSESGVRAPWVLALRSEARREGTRRRVVVRSAAAIEPEWLFDAFPEAIVDDEVVRFDADRERVVGESSLRYGKLAIESSAMATIPEARATEVLFAAAKAAGLDRFVGVEGLEQLRQRARFIVEAGRGGALALDRFPALVDAALEHACAGRRSFAELDQANLAALLEAELAAQIGDPRALDRLAPAQIRLPGGRRLRVHYEVDRPPWVGSRLQDFFGMREGPRVLDGAVPVVLHLRAPNRHDVAVTTDLAGFWREHYPALRRQLGRRYPKHDWAEDPLSATPPRARPRRRKR